MTVVMSKQPLCNCDLSKINLTKPNQLPNCPKVWDLFANGLTKGIFQLESNTGRTWSKQLKPQNIEEISALIAIIRPGVLEAIYDGKNLTKRFVDRKFKREEVPKFHPIIDKILKDSYGIIIYQEQAIKIVQETAGFDLKEADSLRKACGKKDSQLMAKVKKSYLEKAKQLNLIPYDKAELLFDWIEKSQRYSFNLAHSVSYAINAYLTAFAKYHYTKEFFTQYLRLAKEKINTKQEIEELIGEAKQFEINVVGPSLLSLQKEFYVDKEGNIRFGIENIKGVGESAAAKLFEYWQDKDIKNLSWYELLNTSDSWASKTVMEGLIGSGGLSHLGIPRRRLLFEYSKWQELSKGERKWLTPRNYPTVKTALLDLLSNNIPTARRQDTIKGLIKLLDNPPFSLTDDIEWLASEEERLLGAAVNCNKLDNLSDYANTTCQEFESGNSNKKVILVAEIRQIKYHKIKKGQSTGQDMVFLTVKDNTATLDSVLVFPDVLENTPIGGLMKEGVGVIIIGERSERGGLVVKNMRIAE